MIGLAIAAPGLAIWWLNSLNGLPDIGDPFDVAAFRASSIPDDQNAFALLRRANQMVTVPPLNVGKSWREKGAARAAIRPAPGTAIAPSSA